MDESQTTHNRRRKNPTGQRSLVGLATWTK